MESEKAINRRQALRAMGATVAGTVVALREFPRVLAQTEGTPIAEKEPLPEINIVTKEIFDKEHVELSFEPKNINLIVNKKVAISFKNEGVLPHDWSVLPIEHHGDDDMDHEHMMDEHHGQDKTQPEFIIIDDQEDNEGEPGDHKHHHEGKEYLLHMYTDPGQSEKIVVLPTTPGEYTFICTVVGHRDLGMEGRLTVEDKTPEQNQTHDH